MYVLLLAFKLQRYVNLIVMFILKGGVFFDENVRGILFWDYLFDKFKYISLMLYDVGGSGDCFFRLVFYQFYGIVDLYF